MDLSEHSEAVCIECGCLVVGDHPCEAIQPSEFDALGRTIFYIRRGELIMQRARERSK